MSERGMALLQAFAIAALRSGRDDDDDGYSEAKEALATYIAELEQRRAR